MSGVVDDISSVFDDVASTVEGWFGDGSDVASDASSAADAASDASSASDLGTMAADIDTATGNAAESAADTTALSGYAISADNAAAASYTVGMSTGSWGDTNTALGDMAGNLDQATGDEAQMDATSSMDYAMANPDTPVYTNAAIDSATFGPNAVQNNASSSWLSNLFSSSPGSNGSLSSALSGMATANLITGLAGVAVQAYGAYEANKQKAPQNFSGRTPGGGGGGLGLTSVNGGFGLAAGGSTPAPTGVPSALMPNAQAEALGGSGGTQMPSQSSTPSTPGNLSQTVANQAGVGGLIPQGSVNFMKQSPMGGGNG